MHTLLPLPSLWLSARRTPALAARLDGGNGGHRPYNAAAYFPGRTSFFLFLCHLQDMTMQIMQTPFARRIGHQSSPLWPGPHLLSSSTFRSSPVHATIWGNWVLVRPLTYMHLLTSVFSPFLCSNWSTSPIPSFVLCEHTSLLPLLLCGQVAYFQFRVSINGLLTICLQLSQAHRKERNCWISLRKPCQFPMSFSQSTLVLHQRVSESQSFHTTSTPGIVSVQSRCTCVLCMFLNYLSWRFQMQKLKE